MVSFWVTLCGKCHKLAAQAFGSESMGIRTVPLELGGERERDSWAPLLRSTRKVIFSACFVGKMPSMAYQRLNVSSFSGRSVWFRVESGMGCQLCRSASQLCTLGLVPE